jgi:hypothetical protein
VEATGTLVFDENGITLAVEESNHPMINAGATYQYPVKASDGDISLPPVINWYQYQNEYSPSESNYRFWGWSKDGKVAYTYDIADGGVTTTYATIFNFVKDKATWSKNGLLDYDDNGNVLPPSEVFLQEFRNACIKNEIEFVQAKYRKLPIVHNNKTYKVVLELAKVEREDGPEVVDNYRILAYTDGKRKVVHKAKDEEYDTYNIFLLGYFISPFENKVLFVMGSHIIGGHVFTFFVGCDLDGGFDTAAPVTFTVGEVEGETEQTYTFFDKSERLYITITPSGMVTDFRYVSIGFNDNGNPIVDKTLYTIPQFSDGEILALGWQSSRIPNRGISYMDGGQRKYFYLREDGMDGSVGLVEFKNSKQ